jgi:hypothetical protein
MRSALLLAAMVLLQGCAATAFTQSYRLEHGLQDGDLRGVRLLTSEELVLQRASAVREPGSEQGAYQASTSSVMQEIVIPAGSGLVVLKVVRTPGPPEVEYLQVALSKDAPTKSLWFSTLHPVRAGYYELTPVAQLSEAGEPVLGAKDGVRYDGLDYRLRDPGMWQTHLCLGGAVEARVKLGLKTGP